MDRTVFTEKITNVYKYYEYLCI